MNVTVVGAGLAGVRVIERLRARGVSAQITVLGAEHHVPYDRPPLSKGVVRGEHGVRPLLTDSEIASLAIDLRLGTRATGLDLKRRRLLTARGDLAFDTLIIATGAEPRRVAGIGGMAFRTRDDALAVAAQLAARPTIAIIGAGLIGCELAASAAQLGARVHLVDTLDDPMARVLGAGFPGKVAALHESHGVELHLGTRVVERTSTGVVLADRCAVKADLVIEAVGVRPVTDWLSGTDLATGGGVVCDKRGRTRVPGVHALGDVALWDGERSEHWTAATQQADCVAADIAGHDMPLPELPYWWSDQYGIRFQGLGRTDQADEIRHVPWGTGGAIALYGRAGRVIGAVGMSAAGGLMRLRPAIAQSASLGQAAEQLV